MDEFLAAIAAAPLMGQAGAAPAIVESHFPNRMCQFIWRNWELVNTERIAAALGTSPRNVLRLGAAMGLPAKRELRDDQLRRIYVTVIRQNWHIAARSATGATVGLGPGAAGVHAERRRLSGPQAGSEAGL